MMEQMTLSELKTGMHVVLRNGDEMVVMKGAQNEDGIVNLPNTTSDRGSWCDLSTYRNNMTNLTMSSLDIVRVYDIHIYYDAVFKNIKNNHEYDDMIIYEEEAITRAEAERRLGVRIID